MAQLRDGGTEDLLERVSHHAVIRYCERILRARYTPLPEMTEAQSAEAWCRAARTKPGRVRRAILTPLVAAAVRAGLSIRIVSGDHVAGLQCGTVATIMDPYRHRAEKGPSTQAEFARWQRREFAREKRRPHRKTEPA